MILEISDGKKTVSGEYEGAELWARIEAANKLGATWSLYGTGEEMLVAARG